MGTRAYRTWSSQVPSFGEARGTTQVPRVRIRSFFVALGLLSFLLVAACGGDNYVVGEGGSCSTEGWVGGHGVCAEGYVCDELAGWTCVVANNPCSGVSYPYPSPSPAPVPDAAADASRADAGDAGSEGEKDAGISGLDGG